MTPYLDPLQPTVPTYARKYLLGFLPVFSSFFVAVCAVPLGLVLFGCCLPGFFLGFYLFCFLLLSFVLLCFLVLLCQDRLDELPSLLLACIPLLHPVLPPLLRCFWFPPVPCFDPCSLLSAWRLGSSDVGDRLLESDVGLLVPRLSGLSFHWCSLGCWCGLLEGCLPPLQLL